MGCSIEEVPRARGVVEIDRRRPLLDDVGVPHLRLERAPLCCPTRACSSRGASTRRVGSAPARSWAEGLDDSAGVAVSQGPRVQFRVRFA
eukprot:4714959-Pyramimonas_sp.AAC.1